MSFVTTALLKIFGSRNERLLKRYRRIVHQINAQEEKISAMTDEQLRQRTLELHTALVGGPGPKDRPTMRPSEAIPEAFAIIRESMDRNIGIRNIFNPEDTEFQVKFDPDKLDDKCLELYDKVQQRMIQTGESWQTVAIPVELYQAVRKLFPESRPPFRARCFDVQLIGGMVLYDGQIAEMATGEGKTFVAPLACFMKVLEGYHTHVVTVNDYLVRRDASWVRPAFEALGMSVGYIQSDMDAGGDIRKRQYGCDITYGTNSEFGFDYLRDNMKDRREAQVQGPLDFAIVDEVDSILIDEARTPLIISGAAHDDAPKYRRADEVARKVIELNKPWDQVERGVDAAKRAIKTAEGDEEKAKNKQDKEAARRRRAEGQRQLEEAEAKKEGLTQYYEVELDRKSVHLTHEGIAAAQDFAGVGSFYLGDNVEWPHLMEQAMRAHVVYERDKDYVVERAKRSGEMEVIIVDEFTGRKMEGRQWSDGLHQATEAKERVTIKQETQTLATITLQNFFKLYRSLSGMTGTALTEGEEFHKIYSLDVVSIPTNRKVIRQDNQDRIYRKEREKWDAIIDEIKAYSDAGRPVLVGTTSVEKSEKISSMLKRKYGVQHEVLNAKQHEREAHIVALAGQQHINAHGELVGNVTIATNMAGRGTDIKPSPEAFYDVVAKPDDDGEGKFKVKQRRTDKTLEIDPEDEESTLSWVLQLEADAKAVGGLHVIGTERHTARRIDNQLRGRSGRQGDPGSSRFYVSLEDELMKMFAPEWTIKVLGWLGMEEGEAIEDKHISKGIIKAQKKVEERNFMQRKNLLDYDEVMDYQRSTFYGMRQKVLEGRGVDQVIWGMISEAIEDAVDKYVTRDYVATNISEWASKNFETTIDAGELHGRHDLMELEEYIKSVARNQVSNDLEANLEEFLGEDPTDNTGWDAKGLSSWVQSRFHVSLPPSKLRTMELVDLHDTLHDAAIEMVNNRDVAGLSKYLEPNYALGELSRWAREKFSIDVKPQEMVEPGGRDNQARPAEQIVELIESRARENYRRREIEYPVDHMLTIAHGGDVATDSPYAAEYIRAWARGKYGVDLSADHIREQGRRLRDELIGLQEKHLSDEKMDEVISALLAPKDGKDPDLDEVAARFNQRFGGKITGDDLSDEIDALGQSDGRDAEDSQLRQAVRSRTRRVLRQELTDLEQFVLVQIFDQSWKDHLYAMDMLKTGIGLVGFAEEDPRIKYKKEGFNYFQQMMSGVRDKVTDLVFRARVSGARTQARSAYRETAATHEGATGYGVAEHLATSGPVDRPPESEGDAEVEAKVKTVVREAPKVGRNDPCPCGSGKKYKKCCGVNVV